MSAHEVHLTQDDKYAHLYMAQCQCGWHTFGYVTARHAEMVGASHLRSSDPIVLTPTGVGSVHETPMRVSEFGLGES